KTRHVCIVGQFQISIQPIPSPHIHPVRLDNGIKGKKRIELDLRILRDVFQNPRYNETRSVTTVMRNGFAYRIFFVKQFPGGWLSEHSAFRLLQYCFSISFYQLEIKHVQKSRIHKKSSGEIKS